MVKTKDYVFTLNNYVASDIDELEGFYQDHCEYLCYGKEIGEQGTPHLQGVMRLKVRKTITTLKKAIGDRYHLEPKRGSWEQAINYCMKDGDVTVFGEAPSGGQGKRNDLHAVKKLIDDNGSIEEVADQHFAEFCRFEKAFRSYKRMKAEKRDWEMEVIILWGPPGTGKTRWAFEQEGSKYFLSTPREGSAVWWDNYNNEEIVVIDDFYGWVRWSFLLKLLDRYPLQVPYKGGFAEFNSKKIIFTSNTSPKNWYNYDDKKVEAALKRRVTKVYQVPEQGSLLEVPNKW